MPAINQYAKQTNAPSIEDDIYLGTIVEATVETEIKDGVRVAKIDKWDKNRLLVTVELDDLEGDDGEPVRLRRSFAISYGVNKSTGTPSGLVQMISVAMGMPAADKGIRHVTTEELVGKRVRVQTITVEKDEQTYTNIAAFLPLPKTKAAPRTPAARELMPAEDPDLNEEIPF